jgi:hypothetical protein
MSNRDTTALRQVKAPMAAAVLGGAAALASPALGIAAAVVTGGAALALGLGLGSAVTGLGGAAAGVQRPPRIDRNSPVAYAALAGRLRPARRLF